MLYKAAIVCCSNGLSLSKKETIERLCFTLKKLGIETVLSDYLFEQFPGSVFSGSGKQRAEALMQFYTNQEIRAIFDVSGGDLSNELLPFLDFDIIAANPKPFFGYSDLTTILNAIYTKTGHPSVLYQVRNLVYEHGERQQLAFSRTLLYHMDDLFAFPYHFVQGESLGGIVAGGNIRCLLKLAGTEYFPDMTDKILLLEAFGGTTPQMVTYLNQLKQMGVFAKIRGILLGTFTKMEELGCQPSMPELVRQYAGKSLPIVKTSAFGHQTDAKAIVIGKEYFFTAADHNT